MMPSSPYDRSNDGVMMAAAVIGVVVLLLAVLWFAFHTQLTWIVLRCTAPLLEWLALLQRAADALHLPQWLSDALVPPDMGVDLPALRQWLARLDPARVTFAEFRRLLAIGGAGLRLPLLAVAAAGSVHVWRRSRAARLKRTLNIHGLARHVMREFPQIRPAIIEGLLDKDPDSGPYRREASPIRFAVHHQLIRARRVAFDGSLSDDLVIPTFDTAKRGVDGYEVVPDRYANGLSALHNRCQLDRAATERVFIDQLGSHWTGSAALPPMVRGLYAALAAFACADKDTCFRLIDQFNRSWRPPRRRQPAQLDLSGVDAVIDRCEPHERVQAVLERHAFVTTVMAGLLEAARLKGRLGSSMFLWLKGVDRGLWYALHQEGGQCGWSEAAGPRAHKLAEQIAEGPLYRPFVATAVSEFEAYLRDIEGWIPLSPTAPEAEMAL